MSISTRCDTNKVTLFGEMMLIRDKSSYVRSNRLGYVAYESGILADFMVVDDSDPESPCFPHAFSRLLYYFPSVETCPPPSQSNGHVKLFYLGSLDELVSAIQMQNNPPQYEASRYQTFLAKLSQLRMAMRVLIAQATITSWIGLTDGENTKSEVAFPERVKVSRSCALSLIQRHFFNHYSIQNGFL